jgi:hypothetical protein
VGLLGISYSALAIQGAAQYVNNRQQLILAFSYFRAALTLQGRGPKSFSSLLSSGSPVKHFRLARDRPAFSQIDRDARWTFKVIRKPLVPLQAPINTMSAFPPKADIG